LVTRFPRAPASVLYVMRSLMPLPRQVRSIHRSLTAKCRRSMQ
jgi:hypothetical protein